MSNWLGLSYAAVVVVVGYWLWKRRGTAVVEVQPQTEAPVRPRKLRATAIIVTLCAAALLTFCLFDSNYRIRYVTAKELEQLVQQHKAAELRVWIMQTYPRSIFKTYTDLPPICHFWLDVKSNDKTSGRYVAPFDDATLPSITAKRLVCPTYVQNRDFEILGAPGRMLPFITAFLIGIGAVYLIKTRRSKMRAV
jgi:hypothetical protein